MLENGTGLPVVGLVMGTGSLIAAVVLFFLKFGGDYIEGAKNAQTRLSAMARGRRPFTVPEA